MMDLKEAYTAFIKAENARGSNKASSYIRAIDLLGPILQRKAPRELRFNNVWQVVSFRQIQNLYEFVLEQQNLKGNGVFGGEEPSSYWNSRFYSAALKSYGQFLVIHQYEERLWEIYRNPKIAAEELPVRLVEQEVESIEELIDEKEFDFESREGRDILRTEKARRGQGFFRKMILAQYQNQCCITGLNVPEVLRASHITGWAEDPPNRMNPANGLCLSATYDAAFDKHLISFDDDYRMILSAGLNDYYTNKAFKEYFLNREGERITIPEQYRPDPSLLEMHRNKL